MAQIDLKNCTIIIRDGYNGGGGWLVNKVPPTGFLVNNVSGYTTGATTMVIDGGTVALATGDAFTVVGDTAGTHVITSHTETLGATTSITFTPAITGTVSDDAVITILDAYPAGATTMLIDGGTTILANGDQFTVVGELGVPPGGGSTTTLNDVLPLHTITGHSETLGVTTSITFTPSLNNWVADDAVVSISPRFVLAHIGEGNLTYSEKRKIKYVTDRGLLDTVKEEDQQPVDVKLDYEWDFLTASTPELIPTIEDALKRKGLASNWLTTSPDPCEIYCVDIVLTNFPPCPNVYIEQIILPMFRWEDLAHDPKTSAVAVTGKCNVIQAETSRIQPPAGLIT